MLALASVDRGGLLAGGTFTSDGTQNLNRVANWDGNQWSPLGAGMNQTVRALHVRPNGEVVAGGDFTMAGDASANHIARWDGAAWSTYGAGRTYNVYGLASDSNGDLIAVGSFANGNSRIDRWDGANWSSLSAPNVEGPIFAVSTKQDGSMDVGGFFTLVRSPTSVVANFARWGCPPVCPGDFNSDGVRDLGDLAALLTHFGTQQGALFSEGDYDQDGDVDLADLANLLIVVGSACP